MKLYIDVETSGLIKYVHGIISLAYIIEDEDNIVMAQGEILMNPLSYSTKVSPKALEVNGYELEQLHNLPDAKEACKKLIDVLNEHYNGRYKLIAYNADFDTGFVQYWMDKFYPGTYGKLIDYKHLDPFQLVKYMQYIGKIDTGKSQSLETVAKHFGFEHNAHDAFSDIKVTRQVHYKLMEILND